VRRPEASTARRRSSQRVAVLALAILSCFYGFPTASATGAGPPAPLPGTGLAFAAAPADPHPAVTTLYDWDPEPFIVSPQFPLESIAGEGASMVTSDPYGTVLLFGGLSPTGLTNVTVLANETTGNWSVAPPGPAPSPRTNASLGVTADGQYAILFGGEVNASTQVVDNETWVFSFISHTWTNVTQPIAPPPRESAAFAVDSPDNVALLEGGWEPAASVSGGGATVIWNDTWTLNLTTLNWSAFPDPTAPRPMYASSMVYDPVDGSFLMFGGCPGLGICSAALRQYHLGRNWSVVSANGDLPPARGAASMVWSSTWEFVMMMGGFEFSQNSYFPLNDTYIYDPDGQTWNLVAGVGPPARYDAAASFLANNGCPGMFLVGGSLALTFQPPDGWFMDANPDIGSGCNIWGGDELGGSSGPPPGPCAPVFNITVRLESSVNRSGIPEGLVTAVGKCGTVRAATGALGDVTFDFPNENVTLTAAAALFHGASDRINTTSVPNDTVLLLLTPLPVIHFFAQGEGPGSSPFAFYALSSVLISYAGGGLGATNASGFLVDPGFSGPLGLTVFSGTRPFYSNATASGIVPYTGNVSVNLTLLQDGLFSFQAYEYPDGHGVGNASGILAPVGAYTYGGPVYFVTAPSGWFNLSLPQGNYTVYVSHPGFTSNSTHGAVFHAWRTPTVVTLSMALAYGSNVSVRLLSAATERPIPAGVVRIGYFPSDTTSTNGWANFTDLLPPGTYNVSGSAAGYRTNSTVVDLTYLTRSTNLTLNLTPLGGCSPECIVTPNGTTVGYRLLPGAGTALDLYIVAPLALVIAAAIYVAYLRRPESEGRLV
jgi:hypothetical protein